MKVIYTILIMTCLILIAGLLGFGIWVYQLEPSGSDIPDCDKPHPYDKNCISSEEKFFDPTIKSPKNIKVYLTNFYNSKGSGGPLYQKCWYRIRYVNAATGGYSDFSDWIEHSVYAGSCDLPYPNDIPDAAQGLDTCGFNIPVIGIKKNDLDYPVFPQSSIIINLHRYISETKPTDDVQDEIVGNLNITIGNYVNWIDAVYPPCKDKCTPTDRCSNQTQCPL